MQIDVVTEYSSSPRKWYNFRIHRQRKYINIFAFECTYIKQILVFSYSNFIWSDTEKYFEAWLYCPRRK